ncbi:MAG: hypothetical protein PHF14_01940 [Verrucomicrobiota bacterium]|nr:hypothetical protein [Verrucomicrobiota bacterium]
MNASLSFQERMVRIVFFSWLGGFIAFVMLWRLAGFEVLQPILVFHLRLINRCSWELWGRKLIPDGGPSTMVVSAYYVFFGAVVGFLFAVRSQKKGVPDRWNEQGHALPTGGDTDDSDHG